MEPCLKVATHTSFFYKKKGKIFGEKERFFKKTKKNVS